MFSTFKRLRQSVVALSSQLIAFKILVKWVLRSFNAIVSREFVRFVKILEFIQLIVQIRKVKHVIHLARTVDWGIEAFFKTLLLKILFLR
jgi:hypothetical protein